MVKTIQISEKLYARLATYAKGFDTPAVVIERILNEKEGVEKDDSNEPQPYVTKGKDYTRYRFNGKNYSKAQLVYSVVKQYVLDNQNITYEKLLSVFPPDLQGFSLSVFEKWEDAVEKYMDKQPRYYISPEMKINLSDYAIAVCNQWGIKNIFKFIGKAKELGYEVVPVGK